MKMINYEFPLNDSMRICLRLEHLFTEVRYRSLAGIEENSSTILIHLLEALNVIDRPDLTSKITKILSNYLQSFTRLKAVAEVDQSKLSVILEQLISILDRFHYLPQKVGDGLQDNEFLKNIRQHMAHPGGICNFALPEYHFWLQQPEAQKQSDLHRWMSEFSLLQEAICLILELTRENGCYKKYAASQGFFQKTLDPKVYGQIIRIKVAKHLNVYPEISVGRHRLSVHFYRPHFHQQGRPESSTQGLEFHLSYCVL